MSVAMWLPLVVLTTTVLAVMLVGAFFPRHTLLWITALTGEAVALAVLPFTRHARPGPPVTPLLGWDGLTLFLTGLLLLAAFAITLISRRYLAVRTVHGESHHREYYALLLLAVTGALLLVASRHFATLFLGIEILSVALFGLIAYPAQQARALEAGMKYIVLSGASSALLLFGLALVYGATGSLAFDAPVPAENLALARGGLLLASAGFGFKLSLVPFHMWTPDVYDGAPLPVSALLAGVSKGAVAAAWLQWLSWSPLGGDAQVRTALALLAALSMVAGNLLALWQQNLKRLLAYSSIGHMGFLLVPFAAGGAIAREAAGYYLAAYVASVVAAFAALIHLSSGAEETAEVNACRGLVWHEPLAAAVLIAALLSLAGIPLTVGFIAKFYVFAAGVEEARWGLVSAVALGSAIGIYYYLRVITALFAEEAMAPAPARGGRGVLLFLLLFIVFYGVIPAPLIDAIRAAVAR